MEPGHSLAGSVSGSLAGCIPGGGWSHSLPMKQDLLPSSCTSVGRIQFFKDH